MRSPTRTLLLLVAVALAGVAILAWLSRQYRTMLPPSRAGIAVGAGIETKIQAFVEVRRALKARLAREPGSADALVAALARGDVPAGEPGGGLAGRLRSTRDEVLKRTGLDAQEYRSLGRSYRTWRERGSTGDPSTDTSFNALRGELAAADLGRYEPLGD